MIRLVVLISGSGSNLQAIIDACKLKTLEAEIALVVSNRKAAYGLERAKQANIPTLYFPLKPYSDKGKPRQEYDRDLAKMLQPYRPELIVLAGFMHIFSKDFLDVFPNTINLHPALPGQFPGAHAIQEAFEAFKDKKLDHSGCMVHVVTPELDAGPIIGTAKVSFESGDTLEIFTQRMHQTEHKLLVESIETYLSNIEL
jgi:formyltetrahydrofolate-dependent phosphoribosylglycinamide formyltransferase